MIYKMKLLVLAVLILPAFSLKGQDLEIGVFGGLAGYMGDYTNLGDISTYLSIGNRKNTGIGFDNWTAGVFARMEFNQQSKSFLAKNAGIRFNYSRTVLKGAADDGRLFFSGKISETDILYELNIRNKPKEGVKHFWNPYVMAGVGLAFYDVDNYASAAHVNRSSFSIPAGAGVKYAPGGPWKFGVELAGRLIGDDIDGRKRTNRVGFDIYKTLSLRMSYTIAGQYL